MSRESAYFIVRNLDGKHDLKELKQELDTLRIVRQRQHAKPPCQR